MISSKKTVILVFALMIFCQCSGWASSNPKTIYLVPVSGTVEPGMAAYIKRSLTQIEDQIKTRINEGGESGKLEKSVRENSLIVFKMDTFGGRVDAALDIVDVISNIPKIKTIAYVEKRAISAGALIALSSAQLYMKENTIIGDCAPIIQTQEGQKVAGEKIQTVLRARFRALAKKNNYPVVLAESMVTMEMEVYEIQQDGKRLFLDQNDYNDLTPEEKKKIKSKKTIVAKGELLTMDDQEAVALGFSQKSMGSIEQLYDVLGYGGAQVVTLEETWSESLVRVLQPILPLLMLVGIAAVYTEIKAPGFGFPGIVGIFCLALVFFNQYLVGLADYTELLLFLLGALLLGVEVFVLPGFGVAGISAVVVFAVGLVLAFQDFVLPDPDFPWQGKQLMLNVAQVLGSFMLAFFGSLFMVRYVLPGLSRVTGGPYLETTLAQSDVDAMDDYALSPGDTGVAFTALRPSGKVVINSQKFDAVTQGDFIEKEQKIRVIKIEASHVIVEPVEP